MTTLKKNLPVGSKRKEDAGGCTIGAGKAAFSWTSPSTPWESLLHFPEQDTLKREKLTGVKSVGILQEKMGNKVS